jgi:hypothetical protein
MIRVSTGYFGGLFRDSFHDAQRALASLKAADAILFFPSRSFGTVASASNQNGYGFKNASRSALIVAASVVGMPCGKPL